MNIKSKGVLALCIIIFTTSSCRKDDPLNVQAEILSYDLPFVSSDVLMESNEKSITVLFPEEMVGAENIVADFTLSEGASATVGSIEQVSGQTKNNFDAPFFYNILAEDGVNQSIWKIMPVNNSFTISWGLGGFMKGSASNDRDYNWYYDQANSGTFAGVNCGPTSTTMAAKWHDPGFSKLPSDARDAYRPEGGWWYTSDINNYLNDNNIPNYFIALSSDAGGTEYIIKREIDKGNILILCLDMYYISPEMSANYHAGKFYTTSGTGWGHFFVVKGYKEVDKNIFFEIYDPYCFGMTYQDGALKGIDRYYSAADIYSATSIWWNNAIIIPPQDSKGIPDNAIDPSEIKHKWGK
jgi:hypothetical protein